MEYVSTFEGSKFELVLDMKELAEKGLAAEVIDEVNAMDQDFFNQNPVLLFQLKQVEPILPAKTYLMIPILTPTYPLR